MFVFGLLIVSKACKSTLVTKHISVIREFRKYRQQTECLTCYNGLQFLNWNLILLQENDWQWKIYKLNHVPISEFIVTITCVTCPIGLELSQNILQHFLATCVTIFATNIRTPHTLWDYNVCFYPQTNRIIAIRLPSTKLFLLLLFSL